MRFTSARRAHARRRLSHRARSREEPRDPAGGCRDSTEYLDFYTFFGSAPLGMNPPGLFDDPTTRSELVAAAANKPANAEVPTVQLAEFVTTFARVLGDPALPHLFFVEGGALAVENALKCSFDWKSRRNEAAGRSSELGTKVPAPEARLPRPKRLHALR